MTQTETLIRNVSDTARWVAVYRAHESARPDALFHDPFAQRLAGERGEQIARLFPFSNKDSWPFVARTCVFDNFVQDEVRQGADMVVNLAAGLDARPYRMPLPLTLKWVEVDLPEIIDYKEQILGSEKPSCAVERVRLDLSNVSARRELFAQLGGRCKRALIISEGLITYLTEDEAGVFAQDLAAPGSFHSWAVDFASPALLRMLQRKIGKQMTQAPLKFAPKDGPDFFSRHGWKAVTVHSILKTAARVKRLPFFLRLMAVLPEANPPWSRIWSGACLFRKQ